MTLAGTTHNPFDKRMADSERLDAKGPVTTEAGTARLGYVIAIVVNVVLLVVVQNILGSDLAPFLTADFALVEPWITLSLTASILANVVYLRNVTPQVKAIGQIVINLIRVVVTYRILVVFPFDFTGYDFDWETVARVVLILAMVGSFIGAAAELPKLITPRTVRR